MNAKNPPKRRLSPVLKHPLFLGALFVLVINDHLLKGSGLLPGALTGKISDFAGLIVAPWVLVALLGLSKKRAISRAHIAVGVVFAAINVSALAARTFEKLTALTPFPWAITVDPTDLLGLWALFVSFRILLPVHITPDARASRRPQQVAAQLLKGATFASALLACMATSPPPFPAQVPLHLANDTEQVVDVRVRMLKESVRFDCAFVAEAPARRLSRELFAPAQVFRLNENTAMALWEDFNNSCTAFLVDGANLPPTLLFWEQDGSRHQFNAVSSELSEDAAVFIRGGSSGLSFSTHEANIGGLPANRSDASGCEIPDQGTSVDWSTPVPTGNRILERVTSSPDGCHRLLFENSNAAAFYMCTGSDFPFEAGAELEVIELGSRVALISGARRLEIGRTNSFHGTLEITLVASESAGCNGSINSCGELQIPLQVELQSETSTDPLRAGQSIEMDDGQTTLTILRAFRTPIFDEACGVDDLEESRHLELIEYRLVQGF
jgi:hypothetical protein